ncbi:MAG: phosphodiester glycosidase family protein [Planctomycetes bacterium]|nr:phosphodiester glycosidase family protein [Planctomycetota bacterium]
MVTWLDACREDIARRGLDPELAEVLRAFGGDTAPGPAALDAPLPRETLPARIDTVLGAEVDPHQAALFARRFRAVSALLDQRSEPEARLLQVMLYRRGAQLLDEAAPHALRVRALVDFVWSQAAVLQHRREDAPTLEDLVAGLQTRALGPGLSHGLIEGVSQEGPIHVNVLRARAPRLRTLDARGAGGLVELARAHGAPAAISGGFFLYSEPDIEPPSQRTDPVGFLVDQGQLSGPPVFRRASLLQCTAGSLRIARVGLHGVCVRIGATVAEVGRDAQAVHRAHAEHVEAGPGRAVAIVGRKVVAVSQGALRVPLAGFVLLLPPGPAIEVGALVDYTLPGPALRAAMAGGPLLLGPDALDLTQEDFAGSAPPLTFSRDETYDRNLLPRMGVGLTAADELVVVAVDGRNAERAPGLTLRATARLLEALGCTRAMNLDGGSSKRMVVDGRVVDLPSTGVVAAGSEPEGIRPVHSAILFLPD